MNEGQGQPPEQYQPVTPIPQQAQLSQQAPNPVSGIENPGKTTGIVSIVLSCIGLGVFGLIAGIISMNKSKKAGASTTLGLVGTILSVLSILIVGVVMTLLLVTMASYDKIKQHAQDNLTQSNANIVQQRAKVYQTAMGSYPATIAEFEHMSETSLTGISPSGSVIDGKPVTEKEIGYKKCSESGAQVYYFNLNHTLIIAPIGDASATAAC